MNAFWNIRRRPSTGIRIVRSALLLGAAIALPAGVRAIRRMIRNGADHELKDLAGSVRGADAERRHRRRAGRPRKAS